MAQPEKTVFISYRRDVSSYIARSIFQTLQAHGYDVFMDVESIDSGTFDTIILNQIAARAHFLVILTPGTVERCAEPGDWLRREIEHAQDLNRNIVPILANNFSFTEAQPYLTGKLEELSRYNGVTLHHDYFKEGMDKLRDRFLKKPVDAAITPTPPKERAAVQLKIDTVAQEPIPTETQMSAERWFDRGFKAFEEGDYREAISHYDWAIKHNPQYAMAYNNRGLSYSNLGEHQKAIADYSQANKIDPQLALAYINRGLTYNNIGEYQKAIADYSQAIKINPQYAMAYNNRGLSYSNLGEHQKAITDYSQAINIDPQLALAYINRGISYLQLGKYHKAISDYSQAIEIDPKYTWAYIGRGLAYKNSGFSYRWNAISDFRTAVRISSTKAEREFAEDRLRELGEEPGPFSFPSWGRRG